MSRLISRRGLITGGLTAAGASGLAAAARLADRYGLIPPDHGGIYGIGETLTYGSHRFLKSFGSRVREFDRSLISKVPVVNGKPPQNENFERLLAGKFVDWRLEVDGLVVRPASLSLEELKRFPSSSQITHLACEEGWSYIAEWTGVALAQILNSVGALPQAKYVVYFALETFDKGWWDSIDMDEALHPQTLIAYGMNGADLPVGHGAPVRIRIPGQLGYKNIKHLAKITVTDSMKGFGKGLGSGAPEGGYSWYAGI
jgi:DMSO/TMAO reductase YedYZ molybdopterin-dependent catalytic subunit